MSQIQSLSDLVLIEKTQSLVAEEKRVMLVFIDHLREIERRMLFSELGYASLYEFCVRKLGLSEGSAFRRISTMRLVRDMPDVKNSLDSGKISLSTATQLHSFFQAEKKRGKKMTVQSKQEVIDQVIGLSKRECEQKLFMISPGSVPRERERVISPTETEIKIIADQELVDMLRELKGLLAHRFPQAANGDIIKCAIGEMIQDLKKEKMGVKKSQNETEKSEISVSSLSNDASRTAISAPLKREVWSRADGRCECIAADTKLRCSSKHALEIDHIQPISQGGTNALSNLRLVCRNHNQREAIKKVGADLMSRYLPRML